MIYVASSWKNIFQQDIVKLLEKEGFEVYDFKNPTIGNTGFSWNEIDENWKHWKPYEFRENLNNSLAIEGFNLDFEAMQKSDICILVLPAGRSAHTEAGWMKGAGKKVYVYMPVKQEPELMYKIYDAICLSCEGLISVIKDNDMEI